MENPENTDEFKNIVEDWQNSSCSFCGRIVRNLYICNTDKCGAFFCDNCDSKGRNFHLLAIIP